MSVKIYIRDNTSGKTHEYGTNQHDSNLKSRYEPDRAVTP